MSAPGSTRAGALLLQLLHPAAAFCGPTGDASSSSTTDRRSRTSPRRTEAAPAIATDPSHGTARVAARASFATRSGRSRRGPACLLPLACPALCPRRSRPPASAGGGEGRAEGGGGGGGVTAGAERDGKGLRGRRGGRRPRRRVGGDRRATAHRARAPFRDRPMRAVHERRGTATGTEAGNPRGLIGWIGAIVRRTDLDAAEVAAVDALERLLRLPGTTRRPSTDVHAPLPVPRAVDGRRRFFERRSSSGSGVGGGARAMRRVVRAVAAAAHAEGGCAIRELCGVRRLLDAAATHLSPAEGALDLDPIGGGKGESSTDSPAPSAPAPEASIRASRGSVRGASTEDKLALMDELVAAVSTLAHGGQSSRGGANETAKALAGFLSGCSCPRLAARVVALATASRGSQRGRGRGFHPRVRPRGRRGLPRATRRGAERPALNEPGRDQSSATGAGRRGN